MATAMDKRGGGMAAPPYLQGRTPTPGAATAPMITPKSTVAPGENKSSVLGGPQAGRPAIASLPQVPGGQTPPAITPANSPQQAAPGGQPQTGAQTLYEYFKSDLERQRNAAMSNARADAAARGVFYGTPLTTSQGDIETEFLRGQGELQARMLQDQEQNEQSRLGMALQLLQSMPQAKSGGIDPAVLEQFGALFAPRGGPAQSSAPPITPAPGLPKKYDPNTPGYQR